MLKATGALTIRDWSARFTFNMWSMGGFAADWRRLTSIDRKFTMPRTLICRLSAAFEQLPACVGASR